MTDNTLAQARVPAFRFQEPVVPVLMDKADLQAFGLFREMQPQLGAEAPDFGLGQVGQGEEGAGQRGLVMVEEEVALILQRIRGLAQLPLPPGAGDGGVVARFWTTASLA